MQENTKKLTFGAMIVAIFGVLLLVNRQTAGLLEEMFLYMFPIPMVAFSARYDWKNSLPVLVCMTLISFLFGTFSTSFYAISGAVTGLVLGARIYRKKDMTRTMAIVMVLTAAANLLSTYVLASVMGYDLAADLSAMETTMQEAFGKAAEMSGNPATYEAALQLLTPEYIRRLFLISIIVMGLIQGFLVYQLSLLILRRLRYHVPKPTSLAEFAPPRWTGIAALVLFFGYSFSVMNPQGPEIVQLGVQAAGMLAMVYLMAFGYIAVWMWMRKLMPGGGFSRILRVLVPILMLLAMPQVLMLAGVFYISSGLRNYLTGKPSQKEGGNGQPQKPAPGSAEARLQERRSKRMASAMQLMDDYSTGRQKQEE